MKRTRIKDNSSSVLLISKWFIIIAIIIISSLSFTLGFFVGKRISTLTKNQSDLIPPEEILVQNNNEPEEQEALKPKREQNPNINVYTDNKQIPSITKKNDRTLELEDKQTLKSIKPKTTQTSRTPIKKTKYTVQAGAFKSDSDASSLKEKLAKKGYTSYIMKTKTKNHEILYKVMIGEFNTRKEADVLSLKIKKSEGLPTFVIFKTKEDILR